MCILNALILNIISKLYKIFFINHDIILLRQYFRLLLPFQFYFRTYVPQNIFKQFNVIEFNLSNFNKHTVFTNFIQFCGLMKCRKCKVNLLLYLKLVIQAMGILEQILNSQLKRRKDDLSIDDYSQIIIVRLTINCTL